WRARRESCPSMSASMGCRFPTGRGPWRGARSGPSRAVGSSAR
ncbi:MAG: hypothetical protein AVDCRST_MAG79-13, partial [uncultured Thermoleophilia bacterium]